MKTNSFFLKVIRLSIRLMIKLEKFELLEKLEHEILIELGRGWGAETWREEVQILKRQITALDLDPTLIFDVGANIGHYSRELCSNFPRAQVIAFEPNPESFQQLLENLSNFSNFSAFNYGASDRTREDFLYESEVGSPLASIDNTNPIFTRIKIDLVSLDDFCRNADLSPDIMKIDVEGHEFKVMQGATETIKKLKMLQFEFGPTNIHSRVFFKDIWDFLAPLGFEINVMSKVGLIKIRHYKELYESYRTTNYLAIKTKK